MNLIFFLFFNFREENVRLKELLNIRRFAESENSHNTEHTPLISGVHLPEPTEYEYLRNILFEFMIGREPVVSVFFTHYIYI